MPFFQANGIGPAAGFSSSAPDLPKFAQWQFRVLNTAKTELLKPSTLKEMQRVQWINPDGRTTWGLGFVVEDVSGSKYVGHGGSCPGYMTYVTIEPKLKLGVVVMINAAGVSPSSYAKTIIGILNHYASDKKETTPSHRSLSDYAGICNGMDLGSEQVLLPWKGCLLSISFPSGDPLGTNPSYFKPTSTPDQFRYVRRDELPGQLMNFERDASGTVKRVVVNSNSSEKVR